MSDGKYYWLKLKKDFFKRHDIQIVEAMPNGKDYILFYLKLMCESLDHEGNLRFSEQIPYNENMLSTITNTNIDIVRTAVEVFLKLDMIEIMDDGTYYMTEVSRLIGSCANNDNANRQRRFRESKKELALQNVTESVTKNNESKSIEKELEKEKELEVPTLTELKNYISDKKLNVDPQRFFNYYSDKGWNKITDWKAAVEFWHRNERKSKSQFLQEQKTEYDMKELEKALLEKTIKEMGTDG